ncbi:ABC transporter ATP-binding protein [Nonlabens tegetincola]
MPALDVAGLTVTRPVTRTAARRARRAPGEARVGPHVTVLDEVSLAVAPGECLAIVGSSGAGKSVLARSLLGLADPSGNAAWRSSAARFVVDGRDMRRATARQWRELRGTGIALVLQDALQSLDPLRTIEAEVSEALALRGVPRRARRSAALAALAAAGLSDPESLLPLRATALSGGMRQRALIASALVGEPRVLVADEPTTALDPATARQVLAEFGRLRDEGVALVIVSHDLGAVAQSADTIAVLDRGRIVEAGPAAALLAAPVEPATRALVAAMPVGLGGAHQAAERLALVAGGAVPAGGADPILSLHSVTRSFGERGGTFTGVRGVDLKLRRGEIVGVAGESGAGKTTLARLLSGADRPDSGTITSAQGARVRLIPQDPLATFDPRWRVRRILQATLDRAYPRRGRDEPKLAAPALQAQSTPPSPEALLRRVGLDPALLSRRPPTLSGGERQRVAIARALAARPDVLVCDEAVSALDTVTQAGVLELLRSLREELAVVFISHDLAALTSVSDRVVVLRAGQAVSPAEATAFLAAAL